MQGLISAETLGSFSFPLVAPFGICDWYQELGACCRSGQAVILAGSLETTTVTPVFARTNARGLRGACRHVDRSGRFALEEEMGDVGNCIDVSQHRGASTASTGHRDLSGHLRIRARTNPQDYRVHVCLIRILVCTIAFVRTSGVTYVVLFLHSHRVNNPEKSVG